MARKPVTEQVKITSMSNKEEITEIKFSSTNFLKMIITWAIFDAFIWKWVAASASFWFCSSEKLFSSHLIEHYFVAIPYLAIHLFTHSMIIFTSQRLAYSKTVKTVQGMFKTCSGTGYAQFMSSFFWSVFEKWHISLLNDICSSL